MECISIRNFVFDAFRTAALRRRQDGLDFPAPHLERFMKASISHYASHRFVPFNIYDAASTTHPVNPQMHQYLSLYLQGSKLTSLEAAGLTASALLVDAYRAQVHRFRPNIIFSERYRDVVAKLEEIISLNHFAESVWERFVDFAAVQACPICRRENTGVLTLKSPTAGERLLYVGGTNPEDIWCFLNCLRKELNISALSLSDYFDGVIASETGIYFALTIFVEKWTLSDCKYHIKHLKSVKVSKTGLATFGKGLAWDLNQVENSSSVDFVIQTKRWASSNCVAQIETLDDFLEVCSNSSNTDIITNGIVAGMASRSSGILC
ncbi:hypothetical protein PG990_001596 [Apiospora arundinis]